MTDCLWQKPYGKSGYYSQFYHHNVIVCPFMHGGPNGGSDYIQYENDISALRNYHISNGYVHGTKESTIQKYVSIFRNYRPGKNIYIPRRSFNDKELQNKGVHVRVIGTPYHGNVGNFYGLLCPVEVLDNHVDILPGIRRSLSSNKY